MPMNLEHSEIMVSALEQAIATCEHSIKYRSLFVAIRQREDYIEEQRSLLNGYKEVLESLPTYKTNRE